MSSMVLQNVVIRYPHLDQPWSGSPAIQPDYNCQIIIPQDWPQWDELQVCVDQAIRDKFGASPPANLKLPWLNKFLQPNTQAEGPYTGCYFMNLAGKNTKPQVFDQNIQPIPDLRIKEMIFSGCIVNAQVAFAGYQQAGTGVGAYFRNPSIQLVNNQVEPIPDASAQAPEEVFKTIPGAPVATAPVPGAPVPGAPPTGNPWD